MTSPLDKAGADWPAKKRCTSEILSALNPVATLVSGEDFEWNLGGTAVHNGGSCQVGISYDSCETMVVLASWIGGCTLSLCAESSFLLSLESKLIAAFRRRVDLTPSRYQTCRAPTELSSFGPGPTDLE